MPQNAPGTQHVPDAEIACRTFMLLESQGQYRACRRRLWRRGATILYRSSHSKERRPFAPGSKCSRYSRLRWLFLRPSGWGFATPVIEDPTVHSWRCAIRTPRFFQKLGHVLRLAPGIPRQLWRTPLPLSPPEVHSKASCCGFRDREEMPASGSLS